MELYKVQSIEQVTNELILSLIERYKLKEIPRLEKLKNYYLGNSEIKKRKMQDPSKPNNKIANPYGAYIVDIIQGYFLGKPVSYSSDNNDLMSKIQMIYDLNGEQSHNSKMGKQLSISGVAYELMYMNENNEVKFAVLDPKEVFMIYDNSIEQKALAGVRFYEVDDYVSEESVTYIELYTSSTIQYFKLDGEDLVLIDEQPHYFNDVPVICYLNNDEAIGDFEKCLDLIDAYDKCVSDTSNNLEYFADAYLVLQGLDMNEQDITTMKEKRVMILNGENSSAEWLIKGSNTVEIEDFKDRLKEDIHNFSFVPNLNDEAFGNTSSGVSLAYKLFGLENAVSIKERLFEKGLEQRLKLITAILNIKGTGQYVHTDVVMNFQRNLPANLTYLSDLIVKLQGIVSNETLMGLLPFIDDVQYEKMLIDKEKEDTLYENFNQVITDNFNPNIHEKIEIEKI